MDDLERLPYVVERPGHVLDVCFRDGRSNSRRWKDWLVKFARDYANSTRGREPDQFVDLVSGRGHPGLALVMRLEFVHEFDCF